MIIERRGYKVGRLVFIAMQIPILTFYTFSIAQY